MLQSCFLITMRYTHSRVGVGTRTGSNWPIPWVFTRFSSFPEFLRHTLCNNSDLQPRGSIMERRNRSKAWLHFTKQDENSAMCNQCNAVISCKGANTSNMLKHLSTQHGIKYQECVRPPVYECQVSTRTQEVENIYLDYNFFVHDILSRCCSVCLSWICSCSQSFAWHKFGKK